MEVVWGSLLMSLQQLLPAQQVPLALLSVVPLFRIPKVPVTTPCICLTFTVMSKVGAGVEVPLQSLR